MLEDGEEARTGRPWSDVLTVESVDTDGTVVVVPARPAEVVLGPVARPPDDAVVPTLLTVR